MRTIKINRVWNCYRLGVAFLHNGFTYTDGVAKDDVCNNSTTCFGGFKFHGAPKIPDSWYPDNFAGAKNLAIEIAKKVNKAYGRPIAVADYKNNIIFVADDVCYDVVTGEYMSKDDLQELLIERDKEYQKQQALRLEAEANAVYESELR
jgi:hypothetical protein